MASKDRQQQAVDKRGYYNAADIRGIKKTASGRKRFRDVERESARKKQGRSGGSGR